MTKISPFCEGGGKVIVALAVRKILDEEIAQKLV
jgi:hypothetical protein